ncbi:MAG: glucosyl transferase, partial [Ignavibacterium sp.]|uniref:glucosyl transferase n=1 Tax=Ignavibacterium sp. TaxID=2651167 RepID=UPI003296CFFD
TTTNLQLPATINLLQDGNLSETINLLVADTVLYVDSLLPNQTYKFQASIQPFNHSGLPAEGRHSSNELTVTTMDTTSHNFTWQSWEFGQHSSSTLYDVAIIDENNIWAVGEIYMLDSLGRPDPNAYNVVHWDGTKWELKRIYHYSQCNPVDYPPFRAIWAFSDTQIVLTSGGSIGWFNGKTNRPDCSIRPLLTGAINKLWGSSSEDLYAGGNNGNIAHWDGRKWTKIESGTTISISDIYGIVDNFQQKKIYCTVSDILNHPGFYKILVITNNKIDSISWNKNRSTESVWANSKNVIYISGGGVFQNKSGQWIEELSLPLIYTNTIRATGLNDIFAAGAFGFIAHFNGSSWRVYEEFLNYQSKSFYTLSVKNKTIVLVGFNEERALILMGNK